jgi:hypothetical protein
MKLNNLLGLCTETVDLATPVVPALAQPLLSAKLVTLRTATARLAELINQWRGSLLTPELHALDKRRDGDMSEIERTLKTGEKSSNPVKVAAAKQLLPVFKPFWNLRSQPLGSQTALIFELHQRVASVGDYLEALTTLDIMTAWLDMMAANTSFKQLYDQRFAQEAENDTSPAATAVKEAVVTAYEDFCTVTEQALSALPSHALEVLFNAINEVRVKYAPPHRIELTGANTSIAKIDDQAYFGGKALTPIGRTFHQTGTETVELEFPKDFEVSYENNKNVGQATLIVHGKGKYTGQVDTTFYIVRTN